MEASEQAVPADEGRLERMVGRPVPERLKVPACWHCEQPIHPLDDMHHYWCHGGE